jgi:hypothetical protein
MATYEVALPETATSPATDVLTDLPTAEVGEVIFLRDGFWRVDAIEPSQSRNAETRLVVTQTTNEPT